MPVLKEILDWSKGRPIWQQDALRRLTESESLSAADYAEIAILCKQEFGVRVATPVEARPLADEEGTVVEIQTGAVQLSKVHGVENVNALRKDHSLRVAPTGITVVYGENGAGKSGYVRILKQVCRARGSKDAVHPNIYDDGSSPASAKVCYVRQGSPEQPAAANASAKGGEAGGTESNEHEVIWKHGMLGHHELQRVSVFDSRAASVYVTDENEVAYLPHGTDLFPRLVSVVSEVKRKLESELEVVRVARERFETVPVGTRVHDVLTNLHVDIAQERVDAIPSLSEAERSQLVALREEERRMTAEDPASRAKERQLCAARLKAARERLAQLEDAVNESAFQSVRAAREALATAREAAQLARGEAFSNSLVGGVGTEPWKALWVAARSFATTAADPRQSFPPGQDEEVCVLCHQPLTSEAKQRLQRFEEFVQGSTEGMVDAAIKALSWRVQTLKQLRPELLAEQAVLDEIKGLDEELADILANCRLSIERSHKGALQALQDVDSLPDWAVLCHQPNPARERLAELEARVLEQAAHFGAAQNPEALKTVQRALRELEARELLEGLRGAASQEIARYQLKAKLDQCVASANTAPITKKNTDILKQAVSEPLADAFSRHLEALNLLHLPIELSSTGGQKGKAFHGLQLSKKTQGKIPTQDVLSEGEHRGVALAAFFAEIELQESASTIVFDDPVSSMDHGRRGYVAKQIVQIGKARPVLVFTHDLAFLWMLQLAAEEDGVSIAPRLFRRDVHGAGLISEDWQWDGVAVKSRLSSLKTASAQFKKLSDNEPARYEVEIRAFYGKLRNTWERAVEEILLNGAIRRFSPDVQTQKLRKLHNLTEKHLQDLNTGMSKSSAWIDGHDHAAELAKPVPTPVEAEADLGMLVAWVKDVQGAVST